MRIQNLPPERWKEFRALRLEALRTEPDAFGASYENTAKRPDEWWIACLQNARLDPSRTILFATEVDRLVGMAGAYPEQDPGTVDITMMYVSPNLRGRGIGYALLKAVVLAVAPRRVRLCVNDDQVAAASLYWRFGFVTIAETLMVREDGTPYRQLFMELRR